MEFTATLPHLQGFQYFTESATTEACKKFLPDYVLNCRSLLVSALAEAFNVSEDDL